MRNVAGFNNQANITGHRERPPHCCFVVSHRKVTDPWSVDHGYSLSLWHFQRILWELEVVFEDSKKAAVTCDLKSVLQLISNGL